MWLAPKRTRKPSHGSQDGLPFVMELWVRLKSALVRRGDGTSVVQLTNDSTCLPKLWTAHQLLDLINFYERKIQSELAKRRDNAAKPHVIAICLSNSVAYIAAAVAALKAGAIFLPIDPRWPEPRIEEILTHADAVLWLWMEPEVPGGHGLTLPTSMTNDLRCCAMQLASPDAVLCDQLHFDKDVGSSSHVNDDNVSNKLKDPGYVYIMYTSGSTGHPLGVYGSARGIINRCDWMAENYPWDDLDLVCFKTAPCFVDSIWEMFGPLLGGVRLLAAPLSMATDPYLLGKVIYNHGVTHITCVPSFWTRLLCAFEPSNEAPELQGALGNQGFLKLRQVVSSGEMLCGALFHRLQNTLPQGCRILNIYGSTETAADASYFDCSAITGLSFESQAFVPVGIPLPGFIIACIDKISPGISSNPSQVNLLPFGEEGEVVVGNLISGLAANSYYSNQCATSLSFIDVAVKDLHELNSLTNWSTLPASSWEEYRAEQAKRVSLRMVRMGDIGCIQNGVLTLHGRKGDTIKLSGVRVDLEEVRIALLAHPKICRAAVKAWKPFEDASLDSMDPGTCVLVAYVELLSQEEATVDVASLYSWCKARLSEVSIPQRIVIMPTLPSLASSGKVDLQNLPLPSPKNKRQRLDIQSEASVFRIIAECLGHTNIEPSTNIFAAGASSIDAATVADALGIDIFAVYQCPSVRQLSQHLARLKSGAVERDRAKVKSTMQGFNLNFASFIPEKQYLYQKWKVSLSKCVDADPLLASGHVYAKSHSGDIVCCRIEDGRVTWRKDKVCQSSDVQFAWCPLPPSSDIKMDPKPSDGECHDSWPAVLVLVRNDGSLSFLNPLTGDESSRNNDLCGYSIRAVPAVDPWQHWVWVVTHGGGARRPRLLVIDPKSGRMIQSLSSLELPGPSSSKVAFVSSSNGSRYAHIACLDGSVLCTDASCDNSIIWNLKFDAPIFADPTPVVTSLNGDPPTTVVIILTVEGKVSFVKSGQVVWHLCLQGEGFYNNPIIKSRQNNFTNKYEATCMVFASRDGIITVIDELECAFSAVTKEIPRIRSFHAAMVVTRIAFASSFTNSSVILLLTECGHVGLVDLRDGGILDVCKLPSSAYGLTVKGEHVGVGCRDDSCYLLQVSTYC